MAASDRESSSDEDENCSEMLSDEFSLQDSEEENDSMAGDQKINKNDMLTNGHQVNSIESLRIEY